jgi:Ca2+-binding RTX toxin-like protein
MGDNGTNTLTGTAYADAITGNGGNDTLRGGLGHDELTGGGGANIFRFDTALNALFNVDRITDFTPTSSDRIQLENSGTGLFTALTRTGSLSSTAFIRGDTFTSTAQRIRYDSASGDLFYDADGIGGSTSILFATLSPDLAITNTQFVVT